MHCAAVRTKFAARRRAGGLRGAGVDVSMMKALLGYAPKP
jgi:hypothetical protein